MGEIGKEADSACNPTPAMASVADVSGYRGDTMRARVATI
jgi:hypothetical protein